MDPYLLESKKRDLLINKSQLIDSYVAQYFPKMLKRINTNKRVMQLRHDCSEYSECCNGPVVQGNDSSLVCKECGLIIANTAEIIHNPSMNVSYNRNISPYKCYSYKRVNHLREYLRQITGKTMINMADEDMGRVRAEVKKQTIPINRITPDYVRRLLKRLKLNSHYEQATSIARVLKPKLIKDFNN